MTGPLFLVMHVDNRWALPLSPDEEEKELGSLGPLLSASAEWAQDTVAVAVNSGIQGPARLRASPLAGGVDLAGII